MNLRKKSQVTHLEYLQLEVQQQMDAAADDDEDMACTIFRKLLMKKPVAKKLK